MHAGQLTINTDAARELVRAQFPQWRQMSVRRVEAHGTVNAIFRIGARRSARFPLQPGDVSSTRQRLEVEADAARRLLGRTRFRTPEPIATGEPGAGYPLPWAVQTWIPGEVATEHAASGSARFANDLAEFVRDVRAMDTDGRGFTGTNRGGQLTSHDTWMEHCFQRSEALLDVTWLRATWDRFRQLPRSDPDMMTHGDLIPPNLLITNGRLTGVLDVGGLAPADPALDLVGAWHLLGAEPRQQFRHALHCDDLQWARGAAWAFEQAVGLVWYYARSNPGMSALGRSTLTRIAADPPL
jgi:aminoglycoside phosphotransferase (APT) family kinase protein